MLALSIFLAVCMFTVFRWLLEMIALKLRRRALVWAWQTCIEFETIHYRCDPKGKTKRPRDLTTGSRFSFLMHLRANMHSN